MEEEEAVKKMRRVVDEDSSVVSICYTMPGREALRALTLESWRRQTHQNKRLIVIGDLGSHVTVGLPCGQLGYEVERAHPLDKLVMGCKSLDSGTLVAVWEDDDYYRFDFVESLLRDLITHQHEGREWIGSSSAIYHDVSTGELRLLRHQTNPIWGTVIAPAGAIVEAAKTIARSMGWDWRMSSRLFGVLGVPYLVDAPTISVRSFHGNNDWCDRASFGKMAEVEGDLSMVCELHEGYKALRSER